MNHETADKLIILYDNWCPLCVGIKNHLEKLDWLSRLKLIGFRDQENLKDLAADGKNLAKRLHVISGKTSEIFSGIDAVMAITLRVPLLLPAWPVLYLLNKMGLGSRLYDWIATRRKIIPVGRCKDENCRLK
ncbi:thiol-disulfide oxidoreductase DCC family protein [Sporolactobacillus sp. THM19-2]|uniref:thiol-disulfide oxidoreductase DCC family protein n=1 Tax=Sporolactobacillus sp. THM19-2 TaxID=2511171 RepID=UPI0013EDBAF5|nr:DUF393 domain-containing protein [Sporolactobacillus sp. THM19-2]